MAQFLLQGQQDYQQIQQLPIFRQFTTTIPTQTYPTQLKIPDLMNPNGIILAQENTCQSALMSSPSSSLNNSDCMGGKDAKSTTATTTDKVEEEYYDNEISATDDMTEHSYSYPDYTQFENPQQENQLQLLRSSGQASFQFSSEGNESNFNSTQYIYVTLPRNIPSIYETQFYGDIIFESEYSSTEEKSLNSFCNWKIINQAIKYTNFLKLNAQDIQPQNNENFLAAIKICMQQQSQNMYEIANLLTQFSRMYNFVKTGFTKMSEYIDIFSKQDILLRRMKIFEQKSDQFLQSLPQNTLFFGVNLYPNFKTMQVETRSICFSNSLLALVNSDIDQFITVSLKGRTPQFFGWQARLMFLRHKLIAYLRPQTVIQSEIIDLLTRDGMRVPVRVRREKINFEMDKIVPELELGQLSEQLVIYYFDLDPTIRTQIQFMRDNFQIDALDNADQSAEFNTYSLETQAFLDMYYSQFTPSFKQQQKRSLNKNNKITQ